MYFQNIDLYTSQNLLKTRAQKYMFCHVLQQRLSLPKKFTEENIFFDQFAYCPLKKYQLSFFPQIVVTMQNMYRDFLRVGFTQKENVV